MHVSSVTMNFTYRTFKSNSDSDSKHPRAHSLNPVDIAPNGSQVLISVFRDHDDVFNPDTAHILVLLEHVVIDMLRIAHGRKEMRREIDTRLDRLAIHLSNQDAQNASTPEAGLKRQLTTTIPSSSGSLSLSAA